MPTWHTGQAWRVVNSLNKLNEQIRAYAPRAVPPATDIKSWGSIADNAHSMSSDHYPHYYLALGYTAVVCARDFPHAPKLGLDGGIVTEHMRHMRDERVQYIIFNRRITGVNYGWEWHGYTGDDPHDTHFHVSTKHTSIVDHDAPWSLPSGASMAGTGLTFSWGETVDSYVSRIEGIWVPAARRVMTLPTEFPSTGDSGLSDAQMDALADRVAQRIGGTLAGQVADLLAQRMQS